MTQDQITALAREYGEYVADSLGYETDSDFKKENAKQFFQSRQYILTHQEEYDVYIIDDASAEKRLLLCLFPEIEKEVEA